MLPAGSPLSDWLTWLETLSPKEIDLGLDRVQSVLRDLSLELPPNVFLVAGTNGKGSSVHLLQSLLHSAGYRVGAYTSPHILDYNERIAINGTPVADEDIVAAFEQVEKSRRDLPLTYFEYGTLAAMIIFSDATLDVWVLEIGLGGRLDACNAIEPTASLITNVSLDHCEWLGPDVESIAVEKAGVMRPGVPTVFGSSDVPHSLRRHAEALGATLLLAGRDFDYARAADGLWSWTATGIERHALERPGLVGDFQLGNAAAVLALLHAAGMEAALAPAILKRVLPNLALAGRLQRVRCGGANWLLDVAHNPAAAHALAGTLASTRTDGKTWAIIGLLHDKDAASISLALNNEVDTWIAVTAASPRALAADELARRLANACVRPCRISMSLHEAMEFVRRKAAENDRILVTGSFYVVGPALRHLGLYSRSEP